MIAVSLSPLFNDVFNHLWQSTLFGAVAALLALTLTKNHARARHWLWLSASVKFLIPFSLLITIGSHIAWPTATPIAQPRVSVLMQEVSQPFTPPVIPLTTTPATTSPLPFLLLALWACGFAAVFFSWWLRWRRIHAILRAASPLALETEVKVMSSRALLEPGVFGIFRPVLLLPEGITDRLARPQLEAILAHELCHIRRRDNLAAAIHMLVEAIFWFHPLIWWLGARLVDERERACDEAVLQSGSEPQVYAEGILKVCEFYVESPLFCAAGVTGSNLKSRIVRIMTHRIGARLTFGRKLLLATAGMLAIAGPVAIGLMNAPQTHAQSQPSPAFEVASVKMSPLLGSGAVRIIKVAIHGQLTFSGITLKDCISWAYGATNYQISGPNWIDSERYDIRAKAANPVAADELKLMLRSLLADRFTLILHRDQKILPVYALVIGKSGPKIHAVKPEGPSKYFPNSTGLSARQVSMARFAELLSGKVDRPVLDETGLTGVFDIDLNWSRDSGATPEDTAGPSIFTAMQEQLGLKLEARKAPVEILVIDHAEKVPTEN